jgi:hypothetical protein
MFNQGTTDQNMLYNSSNSSKFSGNFDVSFLIGQFESVENPQHLQLKWFKYLSFMVYHKFSQKDCHEILLYHDGMKCVAFQFDLENSRWRHDFFMLQVVKTISKFKICVYF